LSYPANEGIIHYQKREGKTMRIGEIERIGEREVPGWTPKREPVVEPQREPLPEKVPEKEPEKVN